MSAGPLRRPGGRIIALKREINKRATPKNVFCIVAIVGMAALLLCFLFARTDPWSRIFWFNTAEVENWAYTDTGMDFFHSIEYLNGNDPYFHWGTIYPPLANLMFKGIFHVIPMEQKSLWTMDFWDSVHMRRGMNDLRVWMPTMMCYLLFFIVVALFTLSLVTRFKKSKFGGLSAFTLFFGYGYLYALERGNIIVLSMAAALFFVLCYDSPSALVRELALLALAVSANIKLYPAVLGLLLLCDRKWFAAIRAVVYGVLMFTLPCLVFKGGLSNIPRFFQNVATHANRIELNNLGTSLDKVIYSVMALCNRWFSAPIAEEFYTGMAIKLNYAALAMGIACAVILPKRWQKCLGCVVGFILFSNQGIYGTTFLTLPAVLFLQEEERFTWANVVPFIGLLLGIICLPVFNRVGDAFSFTSLRLHIALMLLFGYIVAAAVYSLIRRFRKGAKAAA